MRLDNRRAGAGASDPTHDPGPAEPTTSPTTVERLRRSAAAVPLLLAAAVAVALAAFVVTVWSSELARRGLARVGPYLPVFGYVTALGILVASWSPRLRRSAGTYLPRPLVAAAAFLVACLSYLTTIVFTWERGRGGNTTLGGAVPWADANLYLGGAERLLFFGRLDEYNSNRPLHVMFVGVELTLTNLDLRRAILLQSLLLAVACVLAARAVARTVGAVGGVALFACLFGFSYFYAMTTVTENLGLIVGALAFAALWSSVHTRERWLALSGIALLSIALGIRSGALLLLLVLPVWFAFRWRGDKRIDGRLLLCGLAAATLGTLLNYGAVVGLGGDTSNVNGNAGYLYYGMAQGRPGWDMRTNPMDPAWHEILNDYPELFEPSNAERSAFVNRKAREEVLDHPVRFTTTAIRSGWNYLGIAWDDALATIHQTWVRVSGAGLAAILGAAFLVARWRSSRRQVPIDLGLFAGTVIAMPVLTGLWVPDEPGRAVVGGGLAALGFLAFVVIGTDRLRLGDHLSFTLTALAALAVSIPFLGIDTVRVLAATAPFFAVTVALAVTVLARVPNGASRGRTSETGRGSQTAAPRTGRGPVWIGGALVVVILAGTPIAMAVVERPDLPRVRCPDGTAAEPLVGGIAVELVGDERGAKRAVDQLHIADFHRNTTLFAPFGTGPFSDVRPGQTLMTGLTREGDDRIALVEGAVPAARASTLQLCGNAVHDPPADAWVSLYMSPIDFFYGRPLPSDPSPER